MIRVLVVDDSGFMRLALKKMLANDPMIQVVGEATSGRVQRYDLIQIGRGDQHASVIQADVTIGASGTAR